MNDNLTKHFCFFSTCQKPSSTSINLNSNHFQGGRQCQSSKVLESCSVIVFPARSPRAQLGSRPQPQPPLFLKRFSVEPYLGKTWSQPPFLWMEADTSTQSAQASIERKYSTLHTCGTKILPCEEDGVVVVLGVVGVAPLLRVGPPTHLLQAARWVATLDQAYRLRKNTTMEGEGQVTQTVNRNEIALLFSSLQGSRTCLIKWKTLKRFWNIKQGNLLD